MGVNISGNKINFKQLVTHISSVLSETGLDPSYLEIELTERVMMENTEEARRALLQLKEMGIAIAIDDFGTGYSSLGQLKDFPIDTLKVDRSFIRDLATNSQDKAIASAIIAMGRTLSMTVVAEGVETLEQQEFLRDQACDEMQGFYFSRPISAEELADLLRAHPHLAGAARPGPSTGPAAL